MSKENNIDRLFRDGLSGFSEKPPTHVWDSINSQLNNKRKQRMILWLWKGAAAAAFIGVIILGGILYQSKSIETNNSILSNASEISITNIDSTQSNYQNKNTAVASELNDNHTENILSENINSYNDSNLEIGNKKSVNTVKSENLLVNENKNVIAFVDNNDKTIEGLEPLTSKDGITQTEKINPSFVFFIQNKDVNDKQFADAIFNDTELTDEEKQKRSLLEVVSVGGQISPSYSYRSADGDKANSESGITKLNGGFNLNLKASKRLHVETGLLYAQVGQKFSNTNVFVNNSMVYGLLNSDMGSAMQTDEYQNSLGNISFESSGSDLMADAGSEYSSVADNSVSALKSTTKYDVDVQQELGYIEIPFILKYDIISRGFIISLNGGFSTNLLVGNSAYSLENNYKSKIGSMEGINSVSYSTSFGIGLRTPINQSLDFNLEPRVKYFINSVTSKSGYDYKPYSMGLLIGINYKF